jgi:hypothetical protein
MELQNIDLLQNKLKVVRLNLTDLYEGTVTFETITGKNFDAFFWGQTFKEDDTYLIKFSSLDYNLKWEIIFSENKSQSKSLEKENGYCSYQAYGQILSINPVVVDFGYIKMEIGNWTNDNRVIGDYIYWKIDRLDVSEVRNLAADNS